MDRGWITFFNDEARESTETGDPRQIQSLILQMIPKGGTSLYDSVAGCARRMEKNEGPNRQELRAMFLFTDGDDDASNLSLNEALNAVEAGNLRLFAFAPQLELDRRGKRALEKFTEATGGRFFVPGNTKGLQRAINQVEQDLDNLLEISYIPRLTQSGMPKIDLKSRKRGVSVLAPEQAVFSKIR